MARLRAGEAAALQRRQPASCGRRREIDVRQSARADLGREQALALHEGVDVVCQIALARARLLPIHLDTFPGTYRIAALARGLGATHRRLTWPEFALEGALCHAALRRGRIVWRGALRLLGDRAFGTCDR